MRVGSIANGTGGRAGSHLSRGRGRRVAGLVAA